MKTSPCLALALVASLAAIACGDSGDTSSASSTASSSSGTGGAGGAASDFLCVSSPVPAPFAGDEACPTAKPGVADALNQALASRGINRCDVRLDPADVALSGWPAPMLVDAHRLPDFTALHLGPLRLPPYGRETATWLDDAGKSATPVTSTLTALAARRGHVFSDACFALTPYIVAEGDATPLATAVLTMARARGAPLDEAALVAMAEGVPLELQRRLAPVIGALDLATTEVEASLGATTLAARRFLARSSSLYYSGGYAISLTEKNLALLDAVDLARLEKAAALLASTIERARLAEVPDAMFAPFEVETVIGKITVRGSGADTYEKDGPGEDTALLFDLGGDDTYEVAAGASNEALAVSVAIDVRGADQYRYAETPVPLDAGLLPSDGKGRYASQKPPTEDYGPITLSKTPRQGFGNAGIGLLFDLGSEGDSYRSLGLSQGFGAAGVGALYDAGGDDTYAAEAASQGSSIFGIGALIDAGGKDTYASFTLSQGFGGAQGCGALVDHAGDDDYKCDPGNPAVGGHPLYFSPQLPGTGNSSMSQGAAQGRRPASGSDIAYMAGGIGILRDASGADRYTGSVFAQGAGYWQGLGMLLDGGSGSDVYNGYWYVQGASAHFALSLFADDGGDDRYDPDFTMAATSIGVGHDFSASLHIDGGGDDTYRAPGLSLGSGNINGIGFLVNVGGDDVYEAAGDPTLGAGNYSSEAPFGEPRQGAPTIGVFVDTGGLDTYTVGGVVRPLDGTMWSYEPQPYPAPDMVTTERGCSIDTTGNVDLP